MAKGDPRPRRGLGNSFQPAIDAPRLLPHWLRHCPKRKDALQPIPTSYFIHLPASATLANPAMWDKKPHQYALLKPLPLFHLAQIPNYCKGMNSRSLDKHNVRVNEARSCKELDCHNRDISRELSLGDVNISLVLPTSLNISSSLKFLNLHRTGLQGKLPHYIFNLHSLETLDLSFNSFTGDIPSKLSVNLTHLTYLDLSKNYKLNGTLPSWLFTSPSLEILFLSYNMFSGNVPFESFALPSLKILELSQNQLAGQIDVQTFRQLTNLTVLRLSDNHFSGEWELDTLLSSLTYLEELYLSYSGFSVTTKNDNHYVNPGFKYLELASCKLKVFPKSFRAMKQLERLDLSSNEIHGQIPYWAEEIGGNELVFLNLSHNFITGLRHFQWYGLSELLVGQLPAKYFQSFNSMKNVVKSSTAPEYMYMGGVKGAHDLSAKQEKICIYREMTVRLLKVEKVGLELEVGEGRDLLSYAAIMMIGN
ncbi:Leucine-rich repeat-containing protein [Artemisia annua]|uniref:Leucine-rich repeat-containing protein n=1 Tax=Artemisia annua TaxID=35608 RepID=A0A2U1M646_ARTAN|nr:Leucine-rich repeat-containing protein [Artemisia annua]